MSITGEAGAPVAPRRAAPPAVTGPTGAGGSPFRSAVFDGLPGSAAAARELTRGFLDLLGAGTPPAAPRAREDVELVVAELVGNAVRHAPGPFALTLAPADGAVLVQVADSSDGMPVPRPPDLSGRGGFGWRLVHRLGERVRVTAVPGGGKCVSLHVPW